MKANFNGQMGAQFQDNQPQETAPAPVQTTIPFNNPPPPMVRELYVVDKIGTRQPSNTEISECIYTQNLIRAALEKEPIGCQGKTPVSVLAELLAKRGKEPVYTTHIPEGPSHAPIFRMEASFGTDTAMGVGSTIKQAKHNAAKELLAIIGVNASIFTNETHKDVGPNMEVVDEGSNAVSRLNEYCQRNKWPLAKFEESSKIGEAHKPTFATICLLNNWTEIGEGSSKKVAKREAASKMLNYIMNLNADEKENGILERFEAMDLSRLEPLSEQDSAASEKHFQQMKERNSTTLNELKIINIHKPDLRTRLRELLLKLSSENHFQVVFMHSQEKTMFGQFQCLCELRTNPIGICNGLGNTPEEAEYNSIISAFEYINLMTK